VTEWGLRYYWPIAKYRRDGTLNVKNSVYNYPVQALATAEIIPIAAVYMWHRIYERGLQDKIIPVNTVHDSVISEIHPEHVGDWEEISIQAFTRDVYIGQRERKRVTTSIMMVTWSKLHE
jgi:DNA polymerase I-like protein with 3'-5' exonuclease and polymerase domains